MGDSRGIGPEVIIRALSFPFVRQLADFLVIGDGRRMKSVAKILGVSMPFKPIDIRKLIGSNKVAFSRNAVNILDTKTKDEDLAPLEYIKTAYSLIKGKRAGAVVTAPVNKESITKAGVKFIGHTEYLARLSGAKRIAMMFVGGRLRVTIVTRHLALRKVSGTITKNKIMDAALLTHGFLKDRLGIKSPRIGVCALNPHAGEGGVLGDEEIRIIAPAIKGLRRKISNVSGPLPADSAFNFLYHGTLDGLVAMYHDQAMIPVKMVGRESCVNVTLGLPFVRTSPVHGTAYDITGRFIADPSSMVESMKLAASLAKRC